MSPHQFARARSRAALIALLAISIIVSACAPAATPAPTTAPNQPGYAPRNSVAQPTSAPAAPPAAPAIRATAPSAQSNNPPPVIGAPQLPQQPPASNQQCCPPIFPSPTAASNNDRGYPSYPFISTQADHLSTFGMDVDTASYTRVRDYLQNGQLPPVDEVRVEEMLNYFKMDYPDPQSGAFSINLEGSRSLFGGEGTWLLKVGIQGRHLGEGQRKDALLTFVIDVSGSMADENKIDMVKYGLTQLVDRLKPNDRVSIVAFSDNAWIVLQPTAIESRSRILDAINSLSPTNSTNTEAGLHLGYDLAYRNYRADAINRVILASDGMANVGDTNPDTLSQYAHDYYGRGVYLSTVGVGQGGYDDRFLQQLADKGNGNYSFLDSPAAADRIFGQDLNGTLQVIAKDAKIQVDFNPVAVRSYRLLGYEKRAIADQNFRNDTVDAGEVGAGQNVTALYEVQMNSDGSNDALTVRVRYEDPDTHAIAEISQPFKQSDFQSDFTRTSPRFQLAAAVAQFAEQLRRDPWTQSSRLNDVLTLAQIVQVQLPYDNDVNEFVHLVEQAKYLTQ
jgi:Ca-activated chloride channel homolog